MASSKSDAGKTGPQLAWRGNDPVIFSLVLAALRDADIPTYQIADHHELTLEPIQKPGYGIFVRKEDLSRAEEIVRAALKRP